MSVLLKKGLRRFIQGLGALPWFAPAVALAQEAETLDFPDLADVTTNKAAAAGVLGFLAGLGIIAVIIGLVLFVLWLWALIDVLRRQFPGKEKTVWLILLIGAVVIPFIPFVNFLTVVTWLIPIIYLIVGRKRGTVGGKPQPVQTQPPAQGQE